MVNRLKLAGHSMINKMAQLEIVSNNLANISTKGFKRHKIFVKELNKSLQAFKLPTLDSKTHIPQSEVAIDFSQGALQGTGRPLDVAISGGGLFTVETPEGEAYTRDGRFTLNHEGMLATIDGHLVLGEGGPIEMNLEQRFESDVVVNDQGAVVVGGNVIDTLKIVAVEEPENFEKIGSNLFQLKFATSLNPAENFSVKQGFLEDSNVDAIGEMVAMIEIAHFFETSERFIKTQDSIMNKAVNDIGRVQ